MKKSGFFILVLIFGMTSNSYAFPFAKLISNCRALLTGTSPEWKVDFTVPLSGPFSFTGKKGSFVFVRDLGERIKTRVSILSPKRFLIESTKIIHLQNQMRIKDLKDTDLKNLSNLTLIDAGYHPSGGYEIQLDFTPQNTEQLNAFRIFLSKLQQTLE